MPYFDNQTVLRKFLCFVLGISDEIFIYSIVVAGMPLS
jgi:hypothetical protein